MRMKTWIIAAAILAGIGLGGIAVAQLPNTLNVASAPSGAAPAIRASGIDANVSINLVPKGAGTVQVSGSPIAVSGGTITSLNVNPGPLNVTGPLFIQPGTATGLKRVGARIFHAINDAATTGTVLETLYTFTVQANTLANDGESLRIVAVVTTAANANNKTVLIDFGATNIVTTGAVAFNNDFMYITCDIYRTGATAQKSVCFLNASELNAFGSEVSEATGFRTPAETLSGPVALLVRATTPTAAGDATARVMSVDWHPVGQ